ncbi:MAG: hypothetical protein IJP98_06000 [Clostridia bacterium]|nr:hypothetical protein [Clostridia bacterium]
MNRIAIIDIGSNSVRYMEAEHTETGVLSFGKDLNTTRLAEGQDEARRLQPEPVRRTADAILSYAKLAKERGVPAYAYATSALREASNRDALLSLVGDAVPLEILSGADEGRMAYRGATGGRGTLIDIGGGSFQVVTSSGAFSAPIGAVRFRDRCPNGSPEELWQIICPWADGYLADPKPAELPVTGVGGTITTLAALLAGMRVYDREALKNATLTRTALLPLLELLYAMGEERRAQHPLLKRRYNIILQGGTILRCLMERLSIPSLSPSDRDGMEGYAEEIFARMGK